MSDHATELNRLADIVRLASFATEARRVLVELKGVARVSQDNNYGQLLDFITADCHWDDMPETTSAVLDRVADQMQDMAEALDKAEANQRKR